LSKISVPETRAIIVDFANEVLRRRQSGPKPETAVIDFRDDMRMQRERKVCLVPSEVLRYRKDNGRIASDVLSYERLHGPLNETVEEDQKILAKFLGEKDPEPTQELKNSLLAHGQREPAIITADGFLINGNRRKFALDSLKNPQLTSMRVVILPGVNEEGGPPTLREIEQIENRYQLQTDGKAEYYNFDRALSIRRKEQLGMPLRDQLKDDPNYATLPEKTFEKDMKKFSDEMLGPLKYVDEYLEFLGRDGLYDTISTGRGDSEGRWQAFLDFYKSVGSKLDDPGKRLAMGIDEDEVGNVKDIAFKLIRKRDIRDAPKVHMIMRKLPKLLANEQSRKELMKLNEVPLKPSADALREHEEASNREIDKIWSKEFEKEFAWHVNQAYKHLDRDAEEETPLNLLHAALGKLNHERMTLDAIEISRIPQAMQIARDIQSRAKDIEGELYDMQKNLGKLPGKKS
jgi:hypothetical protein